MLDTPKLPAGIFSSQFFQQREMAGLCFVILQLNFSSYIFHVLPPSHHALSFLSTLKPE
jgi:hypothetical protein